MRKIIVTEFITVDGVISDPHHWNGPFWSDETNEYKHRELFSVDALLLGRVTYDVFAVAWPDRTDEQGYAQRINSMPKYVVSTTLDSANWNNSTLISNDVAARIAKLKEEPGQDILVFGSPTLVDFLADEGLVDEYRLMTFPVAIGGGKHLFKDGRSKVTLALDSLDQLPNGVTVAHYHPISSGQH